MNSSTNSIFSDLGNWVIFLLLLAMTGFFIINGINGIRKKKMVIYKESYYPLIKGGFEVFEGDKARTLIGPTFLLIGFVLFIMLMGYLHTEFKLF